MKTKAAPRAPILNPVRPVPPMPNEEQQQPDSNARVQWILLELSHPVTDVEGFHVLVSLASIRSVEPSNSWAEHADHQGGVIPEQKPRTLFKLFDGQTYACPIMFADTMRLWPTLAKTVQFTVAEVPIVPADDPDE